MSNCYFTINSERNFFAAGDRWDPLENEGGRVKPGIKQYHNKFIGFFRWLFGNAYWIKNKTTKTSIFIVKNSWTKWKERNRPQENYTFHNFVNEIREKLSKPVNVIPIPPKVEKKEEIPLVDIKKEVGEVCDRLQKQIDDFIAWGYDRSLNHIKGQIEQLRQGSQVNEEPFKRWLEGDNLQKRCLVLPQMLQRHLSELITSTFPKRKEEAESKLFKHPQEYFSLMSRLNDFIGKFAQNEYLLEEWLKGPLTQSDLNKLKDNLKSLNFDFEEDPPQLTKLKEALHLEIIDQETFDAFILSYKCNQLKKIVAKFKTSPLLKEAIFKDARQIEKSYDKNYEKLQENLKKLDINSARGTIRELNYQIQALTKLKYIGNRFLGKAIENNHTKNFNPNEIDIILPEIEAWVKSHPIDDISNDIFATSLQYIDKTLELAELQENQWIVKLAQKLKEDLDTLIKHPMKRDLFKVTRLIIYTSPPLTLVYDPNYFFPVIPIDKEFEEIKLRCHAFFPKIYDELEYKYYLTSLALACRNLITKIDKHVEGINERNKIEEANTVKFIDEIVTKISCFEGILPNAPLILEVIKNARTITNSKELQKALLPSKANEELLQHLNPPLEGRKQFIWNSFLQTTLEAFSLTFYTRANAFHKRILDIEFPREYTVDNFLQVMDHYQATITPYKDILKKYQQCAELLNVNVDRLVTAFTRKEDWLTQREAIRKYSAAHATIKEYTKEEIKKEFESRKALLDIVPHPANQELTNLLRVFYLSVMSFLNGETALDIFISMIPGFNLPILMNPSESYPRIYYSPEMQVIEKIRLKQILNELMTARLNFDLLNLKQQIANDQEFHPSTFLLLRHFLFGDSQEFEPLTKDLSKNVTQLDFRALQDVLYHSMLSKYIDELKEALKEEADQFLKQTFTKKHKTIAILIQFRSYIPDYRQIATGYYITAEVLKKFDTLIKEWDALSFFEKMGAKGMSKKIQLAQTLSKF